MDDEQPEQLLEGIVIGSMITVDRAGHDVRRNRAWTEAAPGVPGVRDEDGGLVGRRR